MDPVVHFELPSDDSGRMAKFYSGVFGWQMQSMGPEMGDYVVATTTPLGEDSRPSVPGAINGGFFPRPAEGGPFHPSFVIAVDDIAESSKRIAEAGGTVHGEPAMIPGVGLFVAFTDTEGNRLSILQPVME